MTLESIVLPLAESRALVEAGIVLETAMRWVKNHYNQAPFAIPVWFPPADGEVVLCPAPALSELLDAIITRYPACAFEMLWSDDEWEIDLANDLPQVCQGKSGKNHLQSLAALLMEVSK